MTPSQKQALVALRKAGGEGAISKHGYVIASGQKLPFMGDTWLRLVTMGLLEGRGPMRIGLTDAGQREAVEPAPRTHPDRLPAPYGLTICAAKGAE